MAKRINLTWPIFIVILVSVFITTIVLNHESIDESATKVAGTIDIDNGDEKINWDRYQKIDIELSDELKITESGTYHLTGSLLNSPIIIDAGIGEVKLQLDNVTIINHNGPAIACYSAEDLVIELIGDNIIKDGETYSSDYDEDVTGAIYSKADLTFQGQGKLSIVASYLDGIVGKDDLKFKNGDYSIIANDDGIRGKDSVYIVSGDFIIDSKADAIKSTNETKIGKGFVLIENGDFEITSDAKGIKAFNSILVKNGSFELNTYDDAIHSDNYIGIVDGNIAISAGDDGIHANRELIIDNGKITITKSYEGLEAQAVKINGGNINLKTSDDGINAGGGADSSSANRPGANPFEADEECILSINGGDIYIDASGDGIDSNGWLYLNGGTVTVDGPTSNGNGSLDSGMGIVINGGEIIAVGSSGMAEKFSNSSTELNVNIYLTNSASAKTKIEIKDSSNSSIISHTSLKTFSYIALASSKLQLGETYTVYLNDEAYQSFTINNTTTTIGDSEINQKITPMNKNR